MRAGHVFPTPVGVFLPTTRQNRAAASLPHARGGVSNHIFRDITEAESSPRPWGCFQERSPLGSTPGVFPTPVGVFLIINGVEFKRVSLPHARGGVSLMSARLGGMLRSSPRPWGFFFKDKLSTSA